MKHGKTGFTLIELLVVIAIVGILASFSLVALGNARNKATDARIKNDISQLRTLAETIYDNSNSSYLTVRGCFEITYTDGCVGTLDSVNKVRADLTSSNSNLEVYSNTNEYCIKSILRSNTDLFICADSTGIAKLGSATAMCDSEEEIHC